MSEPGKNHSYPDQPVSWTTRDTLLFALSIGCNPASEQHFIYELDPSFTPFPTYPIILPFKGTSQEVIDFYASQSSSGRGSIPGVPPLDSRRVVDGERHIDFLRPLPASSDGRKFVVKSKVVGVYDKGKPGTVVETEQTLVDSASGEVYTRAVGSGFFVGQGNWGGPKGPKTESYPPPKGKENSPDKTFEHATDDTSAMFYRLNGDYNPLHATPEPGKKMGFGGAILHGLFSWNTTSRGLLKALGGSKAENIKSFAARFASPVKPGDTLVTHVWRTGDVDKDGFEDVRFVTSVKGGKVCLSNGRARIRVVDGGAKL
ncbi:Thioesterase/thiol ester dehydrase-isomerase [Myriangium duriaei CBS 260.36]|uniref:Thioesterase/thiol ester dehydrase-isomerase n=1 Tax=Myriangium duriaei CBS 260.36 TaxID=1168546 RepID=A0A9P4MFR3_9PEZI|nr:Thioesterase/thiol ester dehydrase-isomerase [Myriangium duriaei CBS 260.36]